jgi:hypothetical protein
VSPLLSSPPRSPGPTNLFIHRSMLLFILFRIFDEFYNP